MALRLLFLAILVGLLAIIAWTMLDGQAMRMAAKLPENHAGTCTDLAPDAPPVLVFLGDSLTQGRVSHPFADDVADQLGDAWTVINAGIGSDTAWNAAQRLDAVIACDPAVVVILLGTNDASAMSGAEAEAFFMELKSLPQKPDLEFYQTAMEDIMGRLRAETDARIAIASPPPIGEDLTTYLNALVWEAGAVAESVAAAYDADYLPFYEAHADLLGEAGANAPGCATFTENSPLYFEAVRRRYIFAQSFDAISKARGLRFTTDCIHLNADGAQPLTTMTVGFAQGKGSSA